MKMSYMTHNKMDDLDGKLTVVATSNQRVYLDFINGLKDKNDLIQLYNNQYDSLEKSKWVDFIGDLANYEGMSSRNITALIKEIVKGMSNEDINKFQSMNKSMINMIQEKLFMIDVPLEVTVDLDLKNIFKYAKIHINSALLSNPYDTINMLIKVHLESNDFSLIVLNNLANYLNHDQVTEISSLCNQTGISLVDIEYVNSSDAGIFKGCPYYYIDQDFIDWYN